MSLDRTPLTQGRPRLQKGWRRYQADISEIPIRDEPLERFEFTDVLSLKSLKRYLESAAAPTPLSLPLRIFKA